MNAQKSMRLGSVTLTASDPNGEMLDVSCMLVLMRKNCSVAPTASTLRRPLYLFPRLLHSLFAHLFPLRGRQKRRTQSLWPQRQGARGLVSAVEEGDPMGVFPPDAC